MNAAVDASAGRELPIGSSDAAPLTPTQLENLIECWRVIGTFESDPDMQRFAFNRMRAHIALRNPETIMEMERTKGLR